MKTELLRHQSAVIKAIYKYPDIDYVFFSGGFGCGKSFTIVALLTTLLSWFQGEFLTFGIGGAAIKHLKETVIKDFLTWLDRSHMPYKHNGQDGTIIVGTITFVYFSLDRPDSIFGHNLAAVLADEGGELADKERFAESMTAIQERLRVDMPLTKAVKQWCTENKYPLPKVTDGKTGNRKYGRSPFTISTTTAQGYDGVWSFMNTLTKAKQPYVRIRAKTKDNWHNSQKQLDRLYALYTEDEARVYLEGEYLNLATGRVYAEFDDKKNVYTPFEIYPKERIYAGQDFNAGYNGCVYGVVRAKKIYATKEERWNVVGDAPRLLRERFPDNPITMIPDASGKEIMSGWMSEFDKYNIECFWNNVNPPVSERILVINKLYRLGLLYLFPDCDMLIKGMLLRGFNDEGKPEKGKGPKALDHHCDALEYMVWHITHSLVGFEDILSVLRHRATERLREAA